MCGTTTERGEPFTMKDKAAYEQVIAVMMAKTWKDEEIEALNSMRKVNADVLEEIEDLQGLCRTLGSNKELQSSNPKDIGRTMSVIEHLLSIIHEGVKQERSYMTGLASWRYPAKERV